MVETQAVPDSLVHLDLGLVGHVDVDISLDLQDLVLVVNFPVDNAVSQSLGHNEFDIIGWKVQLSCNISQRYVGVGNGYSSEANSDHNLVESQDHRVESVLQESCLVGLHHFIEVGKLSLQNDLD